jgi:hypothetical protein
MIAVVFLCAIILATLTLCAVGYYLCDYPRPSHRDPSRLPTARVVPERRNYLLAVAVVSGFGVVVGVLIRIIIGWSVR